MKKIRTVIAASTLSLAFFSNALAQEANTLGPAGEGVDNALLYAVAWKQTAAEYRALYHQGYNIARMHVESALARHQDDDKPLAVVTDMDDTILQPLEYWGYLIENNKDFFDDPVWDAWIPSNGVIAAPGAKEFFDFCAENGVEVFYITSREQGENTYAYALEHLKHLNFPYADEAHLTVFRDTSNKEGRQDEIMEDHDVVVFLGDNLNDFRRKYYIKGDVDARIAAMEEDKALFGEKYILFPNPTDGHWMAAVFGQSEPEANDANRLKMKDAATKTAWDGKTGD